MDQFRDELESLKARIAVLEEGRLARIKRSLRRHKRLLSIAAFCALVIPAAIYAVAGVIPYSFSSGSAAVASEVNANFTYLNNVAVPIGGIIGWHQDLSGVPVLPGTGEWVKCDGQTLADANSPMNGQVIPNLNGNGIGANSPGHAAKVQMFLRGGTTSGAGQTDAFQGHEHYLSDDGGGSFVGRGGGSVSADYWGPSNYDGSGNKRRFQTGGGYLVEGTNGTPRTANETRPRNMTVVWIMRVK